MAAAEQATPAIGWVPDGNGHYRCGETAIALEADGYVAPSGGREAATRPRPGPWPFRSDPIGPRAGLVRG